MTADPKPAPRVRDPELMRILHADPHKHCEITGGVDGIGLHAVELHHILPRAQGGDDVRENLIFLEAAIHVLITRNDRHFLQVLGEHIKLYRPDTIAYLYRKLGDSASDWMQRRLYIGEP